MVVILIKEHKIFDATAIDENVVKIKIRLFSLRPIALITKKVTISTGRPDEINDSAHSMC